MRAKRVSAEGPRVRSALDELKKMITQRYPEATFEVSEGDDPHGIYLTVTVDVEDSTEVMGVVVDRMVDMQVEQGLPVYVVIVRPLERVLEELRAWPRHFWQPVDLDTIIPPVQP